MNILSEIGFYQAMIFDTHSHCYFKELLGREDEVDANARAAGITHTVQIGCDLESSKAAIALARRHANWYSTVGHHPVDAQKFHGNPDSYESKLEELIQRNRDMVVAIGETGLDMYHLSPDDQRQKTEIAEQYEWFDRLSKMGKRLSLPLVIHTRNAAKATLDAIRKYDIRSAVIHCYSEDPEFADELLRFSDDIYFSFSGILTYKNSQKVRDTAAMLPLNRIMVETDAPFLAPQPERGKTNEPAYTAHTLETLCSLRPEDPEIVRKQVFENSLRFYRISV